LSGADAPDALQVVHGCPCHRAQRAEFLNQLPADVEGVGAAQAGSDQNGDQFGGTQCHRAVFNEPLAGSFACGLVFEPVAQM
jgi:hypothetical protein